MNNKIIIWVLMAFMLVSNVFAYTLVTTDPLDIGAITTETDPIYSAWDKSTGITINESQISDLTHTIDTNETARVDALYTNVSDWNTAFSWGDHALEGYLTSYTETDPFYFSNPNAYYNSSTFSVDLSDYYFKNETYNQSEVYNKTEINSLLATTTYYPSSINVETGVIDDGNLTSIYYILDGDTLNISEVTGDGIDIYINFTNVTSFDKGTTRAWYDGGSAHYIDICIYNYNATSWDCSWDIEISNDFEILEKTVFNSNDYVNDGVVQTWLNHEGGQGSTQHNLYIDKFVISDGVQAISNNQHNALSGRNDILVNHPNIQDIFYNETEIDNFNYYNLTDFDINDYYLVSNPYGYYNSSTLITDSYFKNETYNKSEVDNITNVLDYMSVGDYVVSSSSTINTSENYLYYSFDTGNYSGNDVYDLSGNLNNGTNSGATLGSSEGILNYSASFDGTDDYITAGTGVFSELTSLSAGGWVKRDTDTDGSIISEWGTGSVYPMQLSTYNPALHGGIDLRFSVATGDALKHLDYTSPIQPGFWHHIIGVYDGAYMYIYINGIQVINTTQTGTLQTSNLNTYVGLNERASYYFDGDLDEISVWNRALNSTEITDLYNFGNGLNPYASTSTTYDDTINITNNLNVNGVVFAEDYITKSKVLDYKELNYTDIYYENIDLWLNDDKSINYDKHPAKQKIKEDKKLVPITETTCEDKFNIINMTTYQECSTKTTGYTEESVVKYGLSMETRVAELERIVYNLILRVNKVKEDTKK